MSYDRSIELEVEVVGTPEEVWRAIATGPGITSWYVPHTVEECKGGAVTASFGSAPEMRVNGRVAAWDPPTRVVFDGGEGVDGLAFEWRVEEREGGSCVVRLVNSGFSADSDGDAYFDAMTEGWRIFMFNLQLHLKHFAGHSATASLSTASWAANRDDAWSTLTDALGISSTPNVGDRVDVETSTAPPLSGVVADVAASRIALVLDRPARGTAFIAAEGGGEQTEVSVWSYLYGYDGAAAVARDEPLWQQWLNGIALAGIQPSGFRLGRVG